MKYIFEIPQLIILKLRVNCMMLVKKDLVSQERCSPPLPE